MNDPNLYGQVAITPADPVIAGSYGTWRITLTVGKHGIDDRGRVILVRRMTDNWEAPQFSRPNAPNYTTVETTGRAVLRAAWDAGAYIRPWRPGIIIDILDGALAPGDTLTITLGDRRGGSPGLRAQTFRQERCEFRLLVDAFGSGQYVAVPNPPRLRVIGGPAARLVARAPSEAVAGRPFSLTVVAEDRYGNPADGCAETIRLSAGPAETAGLILPPPHTLHPDQRGVQRFEGLTLHRAGVYRIAAATGDGRLTTLSNPIICHAAAPAQRLYWGDIHGQTETTVGTGNVAEYLAYGRDVAALDFVSHCANDFQISAEHWRETQEGIRRFHEPGHYVTFLAYEWSGNTPAGGDHNVYYLGDDGPLHRSSHWQIADKSDEETDRYPITALHATLRDRPDVMIIPHIGGRHANLDFCDPRFTPFIEIASVHGVFEWFARDALRRGLQVGFVASSDDHTGRTGATYPSGSNVHFGMPGGLLAAYATDLTRAALWEAFWARRVYATTGQRIILRVSAAGRPMGSAFSATSAPPIDVEVLGTAPLETVQLLRGPDVIYTHPLAADAGRRQLRILWEGARTKWRSRPTHWDGALTLSAGRLRSVEPLAFDDPDQGIIEQTERLVRWRSATSGDPDGLLLDADIAATDRFTFQSEPANFSFTLADLEAGPLIVEAGGLEQRVTVEMIPAGPRPWQAQFSYRDPAPAAGVNAYWLRVLQRDGGMAWSSPIFVTLAG